MKKIVKAHTPLPAEQLKFRALYGDETLSQLFEFEVELVSPSHSLDFKPLLGRPLTLEIETSVGVPRFLNGQITRCVLIGRLNETSREYVYRATVRPWLWYLTQTSDSKIFQNKSVPDVIREVLADYSFPVEFNLTDVYRKWEYCVQYQETDFAFISRLMEHEGIYYWFRHERGKHTLVFIDDISQHPQQSGYEILPYYGPDRIAVPQKEFISRWEVSEQITSGAFATDDYNFTIPDAVLDAKRANPGKYEHSAFEMYEWLGGYTNANEAEHYTRVRLQDLQCRHQQIGGSGNVRGMAPGYRFELRNHPRQAENREYLIVSVRYHVREGGYATGAHESAVFDVAFMVLASNVQFRAPRLTPIPRTHGPQTARVVGKQGEQIWTDNYGRVKVQFHWDRYGRSNENSSCWVRVSSPWASNGFGGIQLPRVDDEVVVDFIGGHPDRPLIIGRVYNAGNMPPWGLPANATQSGFLSRTKDGTPHTANAFMFEDKPGEEEIWLHAEKDQRIEVENNESHWVGRDRSKSIDRDETDKIGRHWKLNTGGYKYESVRLASVQNVGLGKMMNIGLAYNMNVGGLHLRNVGLQMASTVGRDRHDRVVQSWSADIGHTYTVTVRGKAVGDAVDADRQKPVDSSPAFASALPAPVSSSDANQLRMTDSGDTSLSGAKQSRLIGPGGIITIDDSGIRLRGKGIYLEAPVISMTGGDANGLVPVTEADCAECRKKSLSAHPVDVATGQKVLSHQDFALHGRMPIRWHRSYRSADQRRGVLGVAWRLPYSTEVRSGEAGLIYIDNDGRQLQFPLLEAGQAHFHPIEKYTLVREADTSEGATYVVRYGNGIKEHYAVHPQDATRWQLQHVSSRSGQRLDLGYSPKGELIEVRNNMHTVRCTLDDAGRIVSVIRHDISRGSHMAEPLVLASYQYDDHGDLIAATDRQGHVWRYTYNNHLLTEYRTPSGAVHVSQWDGDTPQARCVRTYAVAPSSHAGSDQPQITRDKQFAYFPSTRMTRMTDGLGRTTEFHYNGLWAVERVLQPDGSTVQVHFDGTGSVSGFTDELGRTTRLINDAHGHPTSVIDPAGHVTKFAYDDKGQATQITDPVGQVWQRAYDEAGNLVNVTDPLGNTNAYTYADGLPQSRQDALANVTRMAYTPAGELASITDCSGNTRQYQYDSFGQIVQMTDPAGRVNHYDWTPIGQMEASHMAGLGTWRATYDGTGRPVEHVDPLGRQTHSEWDVFDQPVCQIGPTGDETRFEYDDEGNLLKLTNAKGEVTSFAYDSRDRMVEVTGFDGRRQTFEYNAASELIKRVDHGQDGQLATHMVYDSLGHLIEVQSADGSRTSFRFDARGLLLQAQSAVPGQPPSQITYEYDAAGRRTAEIQAHHGRVWRFTHTLNALGQRDSTDIPHAGTLAWQRYGSGHVHGVLLNQEPLAAFERDTLHREISRTQGGVTHHWQYGLSGLLVAHEWQNLDQRGEPVGDLRPWRSWTYDDAGQLRMLQDAYRGQKTYHYDPEARLISVARRMPDQSTGHEVFEYDPAGNLLATTSGPGLQVADWPVTPQSASGDRVAQLLSSRAQGALQYTYDGHGNRIARAVTAVAPQPAALAGLSAQSESVAPSASSGLSAPSEPDAPSASATSLVPAAADSSAQSLGEDVSSAEPPADALAGGSADTARQGEAAIRYRYDAGHKLVSIEHADGSQTEYRYDALGRRIAKLHRDAQQQATRTTFFVWDGSWMVQEVQQGDTPHHEKRTTYIAHPDRFGPLARLVDGQLQHYVNDHLGTPQELYDAQRNIVWAADYSAYGKLERLIVAQDESPLRFPGQYFDAESGLHYNHFRYYDAEAGRYINQDPIGLGGGLNRYAYVRANPVQSHDPLGLVEWKGESYQISYGPFVGTKYDLRSECVDGRRAIVDVYAAAAGESKGARMGAQGARGLEFVDQLDHVDPSVFNGEYSDVGASATFAFFGRGVGSTQLGGARSSGWITKYYRGYAAGVSATRGASRVTKSLTEPCRPECTECESQSSENALPVYDIPESARPALPTLPPNYMTRMFGGP